MTLSASISRWRRNPLLLGGLVVAVATLWAYLAGGFFLLANQRPFDEATPLTWYRYWTHYGTDPAVQRWLWASATIALVAVTAPALVLLLPARRSLFGDARFARKSEIRKAGLLGTQGIIVGAYGGRYLMFDGAQHVIVSAPTRSGKGVGIVIPNLLAWPDSVVVLDVKQENHAITSRYRRAHGQACYLFNPAAADYRSHRYNPLAYISEDPNFRVDDVQKIAFLLFPDVPGTDVIWTATPRALFVGIVLYLLETPGKMVTLGQVLRETLADGDGAKYFLDLVRVRDLAARARQARRPQAREQAEKDVAALLADRARPAAYQARLADMAIWAHANRAYRETLQAHAIGRCEDGMALPSLLTEIDQVVFDRCAADAGTPLSPACVRGLLAYATIASENTRAGVMTGFRSRLELWNNPLVDAATSANDFDLRDVRRRRMSIYLGVTPDNLDRLAPLLNLFFQQLIDLNTRELPEFHPALRYRCLLLADEFTAMGKVQVLSKGISYIAGYGLRMLPIIQSPAQLVEVYGKDAAQTFMTNHALQVVFPPKASEIQTARDISEWLGYETVKGRSESKGKNLLSRRERSENVSDQRRALLLPQEITSLGRDRELVVVEDCPPILADKVRYFEDPVFVDRLKHVSPTLKALGSRVPTQPQLLAAIKASELAAPTPTIDLDAHHRQVGSAALPAPIWSTTAASTPDPAFEERSVTAADLPTLAALAQSAFAVDFSSVDTPPPGELNTQALHAYADSLCRAAGIKV